MNLANSLNVLVSKFTVNAAKAKVYSLKENCVSAIEERGGASRAH